MQQQGVQSGHSAGSTVAVHQRDLVHGGDQHRNEGVKAAHLHRDGVAELAAHLGSCIHQCVIGVDTVHGEILALQGNGGTHTGGNGSIGGGIHLGSGDHLQLDVAVSLDIVLQHINAALGRTAATGTENRGTIDHIDAILLCQFLSHVFFLHIS